MRAHGFTKLWTWVALAALVVLAGCGGKVVDSERAQTAMERELERVLNLDVVYVFCPDDIEPEPQKRFECRFNPAGAEEVEELV